MVNYKEIIESRYNRQNWQLLLHDIFGNKVKFWNTPSVVPTSSPFARKAIWLGTITLSDEHTISIYEVELADSVDIERNRRGIRDMLLTAWRNNGNAGAFMFCYRQKESVLRFSYVSESWKFTEDGSLQKESTDTKRFTYLLGEGHRSRTAIQQFEKLRDSDLSLQDLTKAFSVEAVSDMFFRGYKQQYENIIFYITGKRMVKVANKWEERQEGRPNKFIMQQFTCFQNPEKAVRDYVKKLMGRLVFLQYLQKKGWLGVAIGAKWGEGDNEFVQHLFDKCTDKDHFVDNVLEVLFDDLNTEREGDKSQLSIFNYQLKVPYLNGGLFEREASDETEFPLPGRYMQNLLEFFSNYNFTIDENAPDDAEVGVDPEMLGRIFENLLEDNKDKGAFYTPKEIVHYMCRESLIAYLQTDVEDEAKKDAIRQFVATHDAAVLGNIADDIDQMLKDVKICDPAIGSGAFPMGLLKELFLCRTAIEGISQEKAAEIKKHIIQQNIYGVDIERGAVDIARLRFWLALIVDEETPHALPNLDYKIVEGNSLITTFDGQYIDLTINSANMQRWSLIKIRSEKKELQKEQRRFFTLSGDEKYRSEIAIKNHILNIIWYQLDYEKQSWENATVEQTGLFGTTTTKGRKKNKAQVMEFTQERQMILDKCEKLMAELNDESKSLKERANITIPFFEWEIIFPDVFDKEGKKGFDIVIGNPPYVNVSNIKPDNYRKILQNLFYSCSNKSDLYSFFLEKGFSLLGNDGVQCYIVPHTWKATISFKKLREIIFTQHCLKQIVNQKMGVFDAIVNPMIILLKNRYEDMYSIKVFDGIGKYKYEINVNEIMEDPNLAVDSESTIEEKLLFKSIEKSKYRLSDVISFSRGIKTSDDKRFLSVDARNEEYKKVYRGRNIKAYSMNWANEYIWYRPDLMREKVGCLPHSKDFFEVPEKLITQRVNSSMQLLVAYDDKQNYFLDTTNVSNYNTLNKNFILKYICGVLNSKIINYWYPHKYRMPTIGGYELSSIPIPEASKEQQKAIADIVDKILELKEENPSADVSVLTQKIDEHIYQLYGLTDDEIKIVEGTD